MKSQVKERKYKTRSVVEKTFQSDDVCIVKGIIVDTECDSELLAGRFFNTINLTSGNVNTEISGSLDILKDRALKDEIADLCISAYEKYSAH